MATITPALLLDQERLIRNVARMRDRAEALGVALRLHMKTAKSLDVADAVVAQGEGITVSTLVEAEAFAGAGYRDILYAVGFEPGKADRVEALLERGVDLQVIVDSPEVASWLATSDIGAGVWIEIDPDGTRCGVSPDDDRLITIGSALGSSLRGVMTHAGGSYACRHGSEIARAAEQERAAVVAAAERLRAAGAAVQGVSVGSTPTATFASDESGVTEMRPGVFMFQDLYQAGLGVCRLDDIAVSVETAVIGHRSNGELVVDAGALALSLDRSTARQELDWGYGAVTDTDGRLLDGLMVRAVTQEHGIVANRAGSIDLERYPIGSRLRVLPNHACMTAAAHAGYHLPDTFWPRITGW